MKIALIIAGSIWYSPYLRIYTRILDANKIDYSIISWNREGDDKPEGFQYNVICSKGHGSAGLRAYRGYVRFIKQTVEHEQFDRLIVFGPQMTCLLSTYLLLHYRGRYMIDYRDLSIEQKPGFKQLFSIMLKFSRINVISSTGFKRCLPKRNYYLSHNFDVNVVKRAIETDNGQGYKVGDVIEVLTIGAIRDYSSNIEVVKALANKKGIELSFVGKGDAADDIADYCQKENISNVSFTGFYKKQEEAGYVQNATFLNIFYPRIITHDTALSNRFYNSLIYKKPMIVTNNTTQGDYVEKYRLGVAINNCDKLDEILCRFLANEDYLSYCERCNNLLESFLKDQEQFENALIAFVTH